LRRGGGAAMLARRQHKEVVMVRTTLGIVSGVIVAALAFAGSCYAALALHPLPAGKTMHSLRDAPAWLEHAPAGALACIVAGFGLAALLGAWCAARIARPHRGGAALTIGAPITVLVIVIAALVPQPDWMPVVAMLLPIPLALCAWRLAIPRAEL
jgi:hypothetical protein